MIRLALLLLLTGCGAASVATRNVPVPLVCQEPVADRPAMPTERLQPGVSLDSFVKAAQAEIMLREGYEGQLRAALVACTAPLKAAP